MGSDNLFHKRKARDTKSLRRKAARRAAYKKILIVCEGEKTEPNYFKEARDCYSLNTVNVEVRGDCGSDPMSIVEFAKQRYQQEERAGDAFDEVYCVFDRNGHAAYSHALNALNSAKPKDTYFAINSVPCFEYWLLLHFKYSARPYTSLTGNSAGNQVIAELRKHLPDYEKGRHGMFTELLDRLGQAMVHARRALQDSKSRREDNPSTRVHELVQVLQGLKNRN